jgi:hypothetical protein
VAWAVGEAGYFYVCSEDYDGDYGSGWDKHCAAPLVSELMEEMRQYMPCVYLLSDHAEAALAGVIRTDLPMEAPTAAEALALLWLKL